MNQFLIFNHHALPFDSKESAFQAVPDFLRLCIKASSLGLHTILVDQNIDKNWFRVELSENYFWHDWYDQNKKSHNMDMITAFLEIKTNQPFFSEEEIGGDLALFEINFGCDKDLSALRAAAWFESMLLSFPTRLPWNSSPIQVIINKIEEDGKYRSNPCEIINLYSTSVLSRYERDLIDKRNASIKSGKDLFKTRKEIFRSVNFCGKTEEQLNNWSNSLTILHQITESLVILDKFSEKWKNGTYSNYSHESVRECGLNHKVSGESETVKNNPDLKREREFYLPDGRKEFFENHIKLSQSFRIHFYPDTEKRIIFVGYIGNHLKLK